MRKISMLLAAAGMAIAAPAMAAFQVTIGSDEAVAGTGNDFVGDLAALGLTRMTAVDASIFLSAKSQLEFAYMASESGFNNTFTANTFSFTEFGNKAWGAQLIGEEATLKGAITNWLFSSSGNAGGPFGIGTKEFGIFFDAGAVVDGVYSSSVLYLGFDDQPGQVPDDNHDDIIIRVTALGGVTPGGVPEPASWAMLIAGFGLVGAAQRRRKGLTVAA